MRAAWLLAAMVVATPCGGGLAVARTAGIPLNTTSGDWPQFGYDPRHSGFAALETTLRRGTVSSLHLLYSVPLPGTVDDAPVFLSGVVTSFGMLDLLFMTTKDGRLIAVDAATGTTVWSRQPATGPKYTTSAPAIDPSRQLVYSYGLEGQVHRYRVGDGSEVTGGGWPQLATLKPQFEKCAPALAVAAAANGHAYLYVANGGYPGDKGDYQGHITAIDLGSGAQKVWNADCSDQPVHFTLGSPDCPHVQSAVWQRGGVVYDSDLDRILVATGNGDFDVPQGYHDWGDSLLELRPDGTGNGALPLDSYTPTNFQLLQEDDADLGSTAPAVLPPVPGSRFPHLAVQGGKDANLRLLNLDNLSGQGRPGQVAGELQIVPVPQGGEVLTAVAVWTDPASGIPWIFVANDSGLSALTVTASGDGTPALTPVWTDPNGGTSPVVANDVVLYVGGTGLRALGARDGALLWSDGGPSRIHWQSPIVVGGRVYVTDGNGKLWAYAPAVASTCIAGATTLCLQGGRFRVETTWANQFNGTSGIAFAIPSTDSTGFFYFTSPSNYELIVKILDINGVIKVFYGELTDLHFTITVTDTRDGAVKTYLNTPGDCGAIDEHGFGAATPAPGAVAKRGTCAPGSNILCLLDQRFAVTVNWMNQFNNTSGRGSPRSLSDQSGLFSFSDPTDVELVMKAVDFGDRTAFFWAALSDFEYDIIVTDTFGGTTKTYHNPAGTYCGGLDNNAFPPAQRPRPP